MTSCIILSYMQRQQLIMNETWAKEYPNVHFSTMRPGIVDTPLLYKYLPVERIQIMRANDILRTPEQGADTIVWLCAAEKVAQQPNAQFYLGAYLIILKPSHVFMNNFSRFNSQGVLFKSITKQI